jgi:uncharacterized membrane protein
MAISLVLLLLLPFLYAGLMAASLAKLHISPPVAAQLVIAIVLGGFINIPITRVAHPEELAANPLATFGLDQFFPRLQRPRRETVIAVNIGGGLIPVGIALYELGYLADQGLNLVLKSAIAALVTTVVCYILARPVPGLGIAMPGFVPPIVSALAAFLLAPDQAPPAALRRRRRRTAGRRGFAAHQGRQSGRHHRHRQRGNFRRHRAIWDLVCVLGLTPS